MIKEYINFWKRGFDFKGRSRRREYWVASLWSLAITYVLLGISMAFMFGSIDASSGGMKGVPFIIGIIFAGVTIIYTLAMLIPMVTLCVRRCHDVGLSGWIYLFCILGCFLCGLGSIAWFVISCLDSKQEDNKWGSNPKSDVYNMYTGTGSIWLSVGVFIASIILYMVLAIVGSFASILGSGVVGNTPEFSPTVVSTTEEDTEVEFLTTENDTEEVIDTEEVVSTESNTSEVETTFAVLDEKTGRPMYRLVNYEYDTSYENGTDMANVIYTFVEPEDYKVNTEYLSDTIGFADTLFFLENENGDSINLSCSVPGGIICYYDQEDPNADLEEVINYELKETDFYTTNNNDFGFDLYEYTYSEDVKYFYAITYFEANSSFVLEFPSIEEFDDIEEVKAFLSENF